MRINDATLKLIMEFEGLRLDAYRDPIGIWTIGYGHSERAPLPPIPHAGMRITQEEAQKVLAADLEHFATRLRPLFTRDATPNEFGAMLSLAFNIGIGAFKKSTCLRRFNAGDVEGAAEALTWFNKAGGRVLRGLVRRREAEQRLMLSEWNERIEDVVENTPRQSLMQSTTVQASTAQITAGIGGAWAALQSLEGTDRTIALGIAGLVVLAGIWIFRERIKKWGRGIR